MKTNITVDALKLSNCQAKHYLAIVLLVLSGLFSTTGFAQQHLRLSTTTSTENSGLLAILNSAFEAQYQTKVDVIAVGTGKALKIGSQGDVDVVLVHAPMAELAYVERGDFIDRRPVMHNDFVMIGPQDDPARLEQADSVADAFGKIAKTKARFISRGDDSGTHKKELFLWQSADIKPRGRWYIEAGQGMGAVITMANQMQAYTLSDRGTYLAFEDKVDLTLLYHQSPPLFNPYHIMAVSPIKHPEIQYDLASQYIDFITSRKGQLLIANFRIKGKQLFYPDAITDLK